MRSFSKRLTRLLLIVVILFPMGVGSFLTFLGASDLYAATFVPITKWEAPYGFLTFTSLKAEHCEWVLLLDDISVDSNNGVLKLWVFFSFVNISSSGEEVIGFQIPYNAEIGPKIQDAEVGGSDNEWEEVPLEVIDREVITVEEEISLVYLKFIASKEAIHYWASFGLVWKGFMVREGFSDYTIMLPISFYQGIHNAVYEYFPNIQIHYGKSLGTTRVGVNIPQGSEVKRVSPLPSEELAQIGQEGHFVSWEFTIPEVLSLVKRLGPNVIAITVSVEVREKTELRNRLFFDSGLYMGLGIGLVISGLGEALKLLLEIRKSKKENYQEIKIA